VEIPFIAQSNCPEFVRQGRQIIRFVQGFSRCRLDGIRDQYGVFHGLRAVFERSGSLVGV
jgi:hypothetical protein